MVIAGIPREEIRHTRAVQNWLAEGREEGREEGRHRLHPVPPPWSSSSPWRKPCSISRAPTTSPPG